MSKRSDAIVKGRDRAAARAMLRATGMDAVSYTHLTLPTIYSV